MRLVVIEERILQAEGKSPYECCVDLVHPDWASPLSELLNVAGVQQYAEADGLACQQGKHYLTLTTTRPGYLSRPAAYFARVRKLIGAADPHAVPVNGSFDLHYTAPVASALIVTLRYGGSEYGWQVGVVGWPVALTGVMNVQAAQEQLARNGYQIRVPLSDPTRHNLWAVPAKSLTPGSDPWKAQCADIARLVMPHLRVHPGGRRNFVRIDH